MSEEDQQIEVVTGPARQQRWSTEQKLPSVEEMCRSCEDDFFGSPAPWLGAEPSVSLAARDERRNRCGGGFKLVHAR